MGNLLVSVGRTVGTKLGFSSVIRSLKKTALGVRYVPPVGQVQFGDLRRPEPFNRNFGYERGGPVDRYYIENFLARYRGDIQGRVLEVKNNDYTLQYGGSNVIQSNIVDIDPQNRRADYIADLTQSDHIPSNTFDCVILTQVLQLVYDTRSAIDTLFRILKPGGVLLMTVPGISQMDYRNMGESWYWAFSEASIKKMLGECFRRETLTIEKWGNVLTAAGLLYALGRQEIKKEEYEFNDADYQVVITARAVK